jgi:G3E family GTPase
LHRSDNASYQIACADRILLNKIDLIDPVEQDRIICDVRRLNPDAACIPTTYAQIPLSQILDMHAFRPELWQPQVAEDIHPHKHPHLQHDHISSASFIFDQPLHLGRLRDWLDTLPHNVFRAKGVVWIHKEDQRVIFHHVGSRQSLYLDRLWQRDEPRYSKIVVIGKDLQRSTLSADLAQTLISAAELIYST